jgi:abortive infection bacteriophage resistance protein
MSDKKVFSTHNKQLRILRRRGLRVPSGKSKRILEKVNYYNLINGYKELFIDTPATSTNEERYRSGSTFSEIYALYNFDNELKMILLRRILRIEATLKSEIAYVFSEMYGYDNYLKVENFDLPPIAHQRYSERLAEIIKLITLIQNDISNSIKHPSIQHYLVQHGYVPLWVLVNILTFGRISYFYQYMKPRERNKVARIYGLNDSQLLSLIKILTLCRNKCAHDERLYDFWTRSTIHDTRFHSSLGIPTRGGTYTRGKHDLFAVLIAIKLLISKKEFQKMITEIKGEINTLSKQLVSISINDVLDKMGFPGNWENLKTL